MKNGLQILRTQTPYWSWMDEFDRVFDGLAAPTQGQAGASHVFAPVYDLEETETWYLLSFDLPGISRESLSIDVLDGQLRVAAERRREKKEEKGGQLRRMERVFGRFERAFTLPKDIDTEKVEAHYEDGVLQVVLPKIERAKPKTIKVQTKDSESGGGLFSQLLGRKKENGDV